MTAVLVTVFCSLSAFAKPPFKVVLLGAYSGDSSTAWHSSLITPVNNTVFGIYSPAMLHDTTQIWFYFNLGSNDLSSFQIHLKRLSTSVQDNSSVNISSYAMYLWDYNGSVTSNQLSIRTQVEASRTINSDGTADYVYTWHKSGDVGTRSAFSFILPFQTFVLTDSPVYFEMISFSVNGESIPVLQYDQDVHEINDVLTGDVGEVSQFDPSADITQSYTDASQAFQNDVDTFTGFINQYNMRTTSERVMFPALLTLSTAGGDLSIILGVCIAACSAGSLIFALRRLHA